MHRSIPGTAAVRWSPKAARLLVSIRWWRAACRASGLPSRLKRRTTSSSSSGKLGVLRVGADGIGSYENLLGIRPHLTLLVSGPDAVVTAAGRDRSGARACAVRRGVESPRTDRPR